MERYIILMSKKHSRTVFVSEKRINFAMNQKHHDDMKATRIMIAGAFVMALCSCTQQSGAQQTESNETAVNDSSAVVKTIMSRRSVRKYQDKPVEREKLELIVKCGINAPSGMNKQPWEVRVIDNAEYINGITEEFKKSNEKAAAEPGFKNMFRNAPAVIFIASPKDGSGQVDCGLLGENMILAAQSMGLGTCCLGGPIHFLKTEKAAVPYIERLALPTDYDLLYAIAVGYPDETPEAKPREEAKVKFVE